MAYSNNSEPRRFWKARQRVRDRHCASCGGRASFHGGHLAFCNVCLEWARQAELSEWGTDD